jgi:hypothetical protein
METEGERDGEKEAAVLPLVGVGPTPIASGHSTIQFCCFSLLPLFWLAQMAGPLEHPSERYSTRVGAIFALAGRMAAPLESALAVSSQATKIPPQYASRKHSETIRRFVSTCVNGIWQPKIYRAHVYDFVM